MSNPPLPGDEPQPAASMMPAPEESSRKRKGKEIPAGEPKKKKPAGPLPKASGGPKLGGQADPSPTTPRQSPGSMAYAGQWLLLDRLLLSGQQRPPGQLLPWSQGPR